MRMDQLRIGMKVSHGSHGQGVVYSVSPMHAEVDFGTNRRTIPATDHDLQPAEPLVNVTGLDSPLTDVMRSTVQMVLRQLNIEAPDQSFVEGLGTRWREGMLTMVPSNDSQPKEVPLETFFHKIVMMRNNLRVLEQKLNAHTGLSDAEKVDLQQYITRCYGSMTTFNVLFRDKEDQF